MNARALPRIAALLLAAAAASAAPAHAQVAGTDCGCTETGAYLEPDPGVKPALGTIDATFSIITSPGGRWRLVRQGPAGPATPSWAVVRVADGATVHPGILANDFAWSPDDDRLYTNYQFGSLGAEVQQHKLWDLAAAGGAAAMWSSPDAAWGSARVRFSADGRGFFFAGVRNVNEITLAVVDVPSGAVYGPGPFLVGNLPADIDADLPENLGAGDTGIAGWGFGPDASRFTYAWRTGNGPDEFAQVLVDVRTGASFATTRNAPSAKWGFSPCGDVFGVVLKQFFNLDPVDAVLYETRRPQQPPLGQQTFAFDTVELRSTATSQVGRLGGVDTPIASNDAANACSAPNVDPVASFAPPEGAVAGQPAAFTDASTDADGTIVAWDWDFGDGATSSARNPSHVFAAAGRYTVRLAVTDDDGATSFAEMAVVVCGDLARTSGKILFTTAAGLGGDVFNRDLFAYDVTSRATAQITDSTWCRTTGTCYTLAYGSGTEFQPRYSPDGSRIVYAPGGFTQNGIWVMDADGDHRVRLTNGSGSTGDFDFHMDPAWSPDGAWIAFVSNDVTVPADQTGIYLIRPDGTGLVKVPGTTFRNPIADKSPDFFPTLAPGCASLPIAQRGPGCYRIAYVHDPFTTPFADTIRSVGGDGSSPSVLVSTQGDYGRLRVSPDGSRIAFLRDQGARTIVVADLADSSFPPLPITFSDQSADAPVWSPDGTLLAYAAAATGTAEVDLYVTDPVGCAASVLRAALGADERPADWRPGTVTQAPVVLSGRAVLGSDTRVGYGGIVLALSGDASATATTAADGSFRFAGLPAGGRFSLTVVSAPGFTFDPTPIPIELGGSAVGVAVLLFPDVATISGTVRLDGAPLEGMTIRAEGPGGPFETTSDADGRYQLTTRRDQTYTISGHAAGFRLDPETRSVWVGTALSLDLVAIAVVELPPGRIAFTSERDGDEEIYVLDLATGAATNLTNDPASDREPAWSPDGSRIAFTSTRDGYPEIFEMDADGANAGGTGLYGFGPAWSPDGTRLAYNAGYGLEIHDRTLGASWSVTFDASDQSPRWRRDGSAQIVFERTVERNGDFETDLFAVDVSDPDAPVELPVVEQPGDDFDPAFSPASAGSRLAYATADGDPANDVGVSAETASGSDRASPGRNPSWSPEGRFVAYDDGGGSLWLFEPGSGNAPTAISESGFDSDPDWQPSGAGACANGLDDDGDGLVDFPADPGCESLTDADETSARFTCDNGFDDDGDGLTDMADPGCPFPYASPEDPPCDNGIDDDGNGLTDADDPKCSPDWPYWESMPACGFGAELPFALGAIAALRRRLARSRSA